MGIWWKDMMIAVCLGLVLPGILLNGAVSRQALPEPAAAGPDLEVPAQTPVKVRTGPSVSRQDLDSYLTRVVLGEMPASFEEEALKAQSVAARTYALKASLTGGKHGDSSICTDAGCCQSYITETSYLEKGGTETSIEKVRSAVEATSGQVLTYDGELIEATYFSCSGGATEDAAAVWGAEFPYLKSVSSPGEEKAAVYTQSRSFTPEEFQEALGRTLPGDPESWFTICTYTEGGGVAAMTICGETYSGTQLRSLLGLRSTAFTLEASPAQILLTTRGYGHRVGMSQYGADAMAASGSSYAQILAHYYPGTALQQLGIDEIQALAYDK